MSDEKPTSLVDELLGSLEETLEERKIKKDRRAVVDPDNPYTAPEKDRRSGKDRRDKKD